VVKPGCGCHQLPQFPPYNTSPSIIATTKEYSCDTYYTVVILLCDIVFIVVVKSLSPMVVKKKEVKVRFVYSIDSGHYSKVL
jgi:hypothetical protein